MILPKRWRILSFRELKCVRFYFFCVDILCISTDTIARHYLLRLRNGRGRGSYQPSGDLGCNGVQSIRALREFCVEIFLGVLT